MIDYIVTLPNIGNFMLDNELVVSVIDLAA